MQHTSILKLLCAAGLLGSLISNTVEAATYPVKYEYFCGGGKSINLEVKLKSWYDPTPPANTQAWTHTGAWGVFVANEGDNILITAKASDPRLHPGISVFRIGANNTAQFKYVPDHLFTQNKDWINVGAIDDTTNKPVGDIRMRIEKFGYDADNNDASLTELNPITDGEEGTLKLEFKVSKSGLYKFYVGGINPGPDLGTTPVPVATSVMLMP